MFRLLSVSSALSASLLSPSRRPHSLRHRCRRPIVLLLVVSNHVARFSIRKEQPLAIDAVTRTPRILSPRRERWGSLAAATLETASLFFSVIAVFPPSRVSLATPRCTRTAALAERWKVCHLFLSAPWQTPHRLSLSPVPFLAPFADRLHRWRGRPVLSRRVALVS